MSENVEQKLQKLLENILNSKYTIYNAHRELENRATSDYSELLQILTKDENDHLNFFYQLYQKYFGKKFEFFEIDNLNGNDSQNILKLTIVSMQSTSTICQKLLLLINSYNLHNLINEVIDDDKKNIHLCRQHLYGNGRNIQYKEMQAETGLFTYTIEPGDTLWFIAQKFNITVDELLAANPQITNPELLYVGNVINIPGDQPFPPSLNGRESLTYLYGGISKSYLKNLDDTKNSIYTVAPDYFDIDENGNLLITPSNKIDIGFINEMHRRGMKVTPFISNHWDRQKGNAALNNRESLSDQLANIITQYDLDGVNIDIENVNEQYRTVYSDFTRLIRQKLPAEKVVSVAVAANPRGFTLGWHGSYDYNILSRYSDYLMLMIYDESYYGSEPGPISSSAFFENSILYALNQGVPKEKIVAGIPFFGRYWKDDNSVGGIGITANDIQYLLNHYSAINRYDEATQSANAIVTIKPGEPEPQLWGGRILTAGEYNIWYDNLLSTRFKLEIINDYDIKGVGSWALGQENKMLWDFYSSALNGGDIPEPPEPEPEPEPSLPGESNLDKVLYILNNSGNTRQVTASSILTRGEAAVTIAGITYVKPEPEGIAFADTLDYWGKDQINALRRRGIVQDVSNNMFYPNLNITKEELTVLFEHVLVLPKTIDYHTINFKDVAPSRWSYNEIAKLCYFDIVEGENKNFFRPTNTMTVVNMAEILDRIEKYGYGMNPDKYLEYVNPGNSELPVPELEPIIDPR